MAAIALEGKKLGLEENKLALEKKKARLGVIYSGDGGSNDEVSADGGHAILACSRVLCLALWWG